MERERRKRGRETERDNRKKATNRLHSVFFNGSVGFFSGGGGGGEG